MKRLILTFLLTLISVASWAHNGLFDYQGIRYSVTDIGSDKVTVDNNTNGMQATYFGDIVIPETVYDEDGKPYTVTGVSIMAFRQSRITSIRLPKTVAHIDDYAFYQTFSLKEVIIEADSHLKDIWQYAFAGSHVEEIRGIPSCLEKISDNAFLDCTDLRILSSVPATCVINEGAFKNCRSLTSEDGTFGGYVANILVNVGEGATDFTVREGTTEIYSNAFKHCSTLTSVTFPEGVDCIPDGNIFEGCKSLKTVKFPTTFTKISDRMFYGCTSLEGMDFSHITDVGNYAFYQCTNLSELRFPSCVKNIGGSAFYRCESLAEVTFSEGIENLGDYSFAFDPALAAVTIPASVLSAPHAFAHCLGLKSVTIKGRTPLDATFYSSENIEIVDVTDLATWCEQSFKTITDNPLFYGALYVGGEKVDHLVIPEGVTSIGNGAFWKCANITSVVIPEGVTTIGEKAFQYCTSLTTLTLPSTIETIGKEAFLYDYCLYEIYDFSSFDFSHNGVIHQSSVNRYAKVYHTSPDEPSVVEKDGDFLFVKTSKGYELIGYNMASTDMVTPDYHNGQTYNIASNAFHNNYRLTSVTLGKGTNIVGFNAFDNCKNLKRALLNEGLTEIKSYAFNDCTSLEYAYIPSTAKLTTDGNCFAGCTGKAVFNNSKIGGYSFFSGAAFDVVEISEGITKIDVALFNMCKLVRRVIIPNTVTTLGNKLFANGNIIDNLVIPASVTAMGKATFNYCSRNITLNCNLTSSMVTNAPFDNAAFTTVKFGPNVTHIAANSFKGCKTIKTLVLPERLANVGDAAFTGNVFTNIYSHAAEAPAITATTFSDYTATLHVPAGAKASYMADENWSKFTNIVEEGVLIPDAIVDFTGDKKIDTDDVVIIEENLLKADNPDASRYDLDGDGTFSIADVTAFVEWLKRKAAK